MYIFGIGAYAMKVVRALEANNIKVKAFVDDNAMASMPGFSVFNRKDVDNIEVNDKKIFIAIGNPDARKSIHAYFQQRNWIIPNVIHPSAIIATEIEPDFGVFVGAGAIIEANVNIGKGSIIDIGAIIDHDVEIDDFVHLKAGQICQPFSKIKSENKI